MFWGWDPQILKVWSIGQRSTILEARGTRPARSWEMSAWGVSSCLSVQRLWVVRWNLTVGLGRCSPNHNQVNKFLKNTPHHVRRPGALQAEPAQTPPFIQTIRSLISYSNYGKMIPAQSLSKLILWCLQWKTMSNKKISLKKFTKKKKKIIPDMKGSGRKL